MCTEKGNHLTFQRFLDTGSELTLVPGDPKCHCGPPVSIGHWSFSSGPAHRGPPGSPTPSCGYIPSYGVHDWNRNTQQWAESLHFGNLPLSPLPSLSCPSQLPLSLLREHHASLLFALLALWVSPIKTSICSSHLREPVNK